MQIIGSIILNRIDMLSELDYLRNELKFIRSTGGNSELELEIRKEIIQYELMLSN